MSMSSSWVSLLFCDGQIYFEMDSRLMLMGMACTDWVNNVKWIEEDSLFLREQVGLVFLDFVVKREM